MELAKVYVYKVYQTKSFSEAARELYVSQPSVSNMVKKLESKLGFDIFNRSNSPLTLTTKGKIYIEYLEDAFESEKNMKHRLNTLSDIKLSVGGTSFLARILLPKICGEFHRLHPDIELKIDLGEAGTIGNLYNNLAQGTLDLKIGYFCDESRFDFIPFFEEHFFVAVRKDYPGAHSLSNYAFTRKEVLSQKNFPPEKTADYKLFNNIKFIRIGRSSTVRQHMSEFMEQCKISPCYCYNSTKIDMDYDMMLEGMGAIVTTDLLIKTKGKENDEVYYFPIDSTYKHQAMVIYSKERPLSESAKEFISILQKNAKKLYL